MGEVEMPDQASRSSVRTLSRRYLLLSAVAGAGALVVACSGAPATTGPQATPTTAPSSTPAPTTAPATAAASTSANPVTLTFMSWAAADTLGRKIDVQLADQYAKEHPGVTIKTEDVPFNDYMKKLQTMFAADIGPDVLWDSIWRQPKFVQAKAVIGLDDLVKGDASIAKYTPAAIEMGKYQGKLYGLPVGASTWVLFYNQQLFQEAGLKSPAELKAGGEWTWDKLKEAALKIGKRDADRLVTQGYMTDRQVYTWDTYAFNNGGRLMSADQKQFTLDAKENVDALQFLADFILTSKVSSTLTDQQGGDYVPRFSTGKLAMMTTWAGSAIDVKNVIKDKFPFDIIEVPSTKNGGPVGGYWHANLINVNSKTKSQEHAWGLTKVAAGAVAEITRVQAGLMNTPIIDDETLIKTFREKLPVKNVGVVIDLLQHSIPLPYNEGWEEQRFKVIEPYMAEVYDGKKKVADTIADINRQCNDLLPK